MFNTLVLSFVVFSSFLVYLLPILSVYHLIYLLACLLTSNHH